jgi:hypothetical protein
MAKHMGLFDKISEKNPAKSKPKGKEMLFKKKTKNITEKDFWNWFANNQSHYLCIHDAEKADVMKRLLDELLEKLHLYCDQLFFEIGGEPENAKIEFIITAEGDVNYFEHVERLVNAFPDIEGWNIIAFKPPMEKGFTINYQGKIFDPSKIIVIPLEHKDYPNAIGLKVCYPDFTEEESEVFTSGTYLILDTVIGEKSSTLDIDYLKVIKTPDNIKDGDYLYLQDLGDHIKKKKSAVWN